MRPWKDAKAEGVRDVASAGGGRPVIFAKIVRVQRRRVKMPRIEPRVLRRFENCSATEIIAAVHDQHVPLRLGTNLCVPKKLECVAI